MLQVFSFCKACCTPPGKLLINGLKIYLPLPIVLGALICPAKVLIFLVPFEDRCVQRVINKRLLSGETQKNSLKDTHLPERQAYFCLSLFFLSGMLMLYLFTVLRLRRKWSWDWQLYIQAIEGTIEGNRGISDTVRPSAKSLIRFHNIWKNTNLYCVI